LPIEIGLFLLFCLIFWSAERLFRRSIAKNRIFYFNLEVQTKTKKCLKIVIDTFPDIEAARFVRSRHGRNGNKMQETIGKISFILHL